MHLLSRPASLAALALGLSAIACSDGPITDTRPLALETAAAATPVGAQDEIAELRAALAPYHRLEAAIDANFKDRITTCWYHGDLGAMGYHYAELARLDGTVERLQPEALVYEPLKGGKYRLVAAEYIVPISAWTGTTPPVLYNRSFDRNDALGLYVMHVWLFSENPLGIFAPWNPKASCEFAAESEDRGPTH